MPFARPTLTQLRNQAATDLSAAIPGADALLRYSNLGVVTDVLAALANGHYGYLDWIAAQVVPFTATGEYLEGWAGLKGVTRLPATTAIGSAVFPGTDGKVVPAGIPVNRSDGVGYVSTADATVASGTVTVPLQAIVPGAAGNALNGTALTLGIGLAGVTGSGTASGPITGGAEIEQDASLRSRMLAAYAKPPQGGAIDDYGEWGLAVPGVTRLWVMPSGMGPGSVVLLFMMDEAQAAFGGFPQGTNGCSTWESRDTAATGDQLALANALFFLQPVTALIYAVAPVPNTINLTIAGIPGASTATKADISNAVIYALRANATPGGVTNISAIEGAIAAVALTAGFVLTTVTASAGTVAPGTAGNITSAAGALPVLGTITYV